MRSGPILEADRNPPAKQLESAGYDAIEFERIDAPVMISSTVDDAIAFQLAIGPAGEIYGEAAELAERQHDKILDALRSELTSYLTSDGVVTGSSSSKVSARDPV